MADIIKVLLLRAESRRMDNLSIVQLLETASEGQIKFWTATDIILAVKHSASEDYKVIMIDSEDLPKIQGYDSSSDNDQLIREHQNVLDFIRAIIKNKKHQRIIVITALPKEPYIDFHRRCELFGAEAVFEKPFALRDIIQQIVAPPCLP